MAPNHTLLYMLQSKPPSHLLIPNFQFLRTRHHQIAYLVDVVGFLQSGIVLSLEDQIIRNLCAVLCFLSRRHSCNRPSKLTYSLGIFRSLCFYRTSFRLKFCLFWSILSGQLHQTLICSANGSLLDHPFYAQMKMNPFEINDEIFGSRISISKGKLQWIMSKSLNLSAKF